MLAPTTIDSPPNQREMPGIHYLTVDWAFEWFFESRVAATTIDATPYAVQIPAVADSFVSKDSRVSRELTCIRLLGSVFSSVTFPATRQTNATHSIRASRDASYSPPMDDWTADNKCSCSPYGTHSSRPLPWQPQQGETFLVSNFPSTHLNCRPPLAAAFLGCINAMFSKWPFPRPSLGQAARLPSIPRRSPAACHWGKLVI